MTPLISTGLRTVLNKWIRRVIATACALLIGLSAQAAQPAGSGKKRFDLPADAAESALKRLSTQSGVGVLFATEMTAGTRTREVRGDFTPLEAANQMLAGTKLIAVLDARTGTLTINRTSAETAEKNGASRSQGNNAPSEGPASETPRAAPRSIPNRAKVEKPGTA